jgi:hypothetical protein
VTERQDAELAAAEQPERPELMCAVEAAAEALSAYYGQSPGDNRTDASIAVTAASPHLYGSLRCGACQEREESAERRAQKAEVELETLRELRQHEQEQLRQMTAQRDNFKTQVMEWRLGDLSFWRKEAEKEAKLRIATEGHVDRLKEQHRRTAIAMERDRQRECILADELAEALQPDTDVPRWIERACAALAKWEEARRGW